MSPQKKTIYQLEVLPIRNRKTCLLLNVYTYIKTRNYVRCQEYSKESVVAINKKGSDSELPFC